MTLKVFKLEFMGIVKVYCVECCKEFEFTTRDHSKNTIHNLFAKKNLNHLVFNIHMQNWC
jgi:hypothetical protein